MDKGFMGVGLIVLGIVVLIVIAIICCRKYIYEPVGVIFGVVLVGIIVALGAGAISNAIATTNAKIEFVGTEATDIYSLNLSSTVNGNFVLGSGNIESNFVYIFYTKDEQDMYSLQHVKAKVTKLKETNELHPCIIKYEGRYVKKNYLTMVGQEWTRDVIYVIYVPEGTMVEAYNAVG